MATARAEGLATDLRAAAEALRAGRLVAFPTETVYGLGADATSATAVARVFAAKGRPTDHPLIAHVADLGGLERCALRVPTAARVLAEALWPGPLTVVVPRSAHVVAEAAGGLDTVGVRCPDHAVALALLAAVDRPVAAPSANRFGRLSPTTAAAVRAALGDAVDLVLDGGPCAVGLESTIVDCTGERPRVLRLGGVPVERLEEVLGAPVDRPAAPGAPRAAGELPVPGTLAAHYAPRAAVVAVEAQDVAATVAELAAAGAGPIAVLGRPVPGAHLAVDVGEDLAAYARRLYAALAEADAAGAATVVAPLPAAGEDGRGLGAAIRDRLRRAAAAG